MKKINGYDKIQESGSFKRLGAGGYVVKLLDVADVPGKEYLKISFDVCEGPEKDFFMNEFKSDTRENKKWPNAGTFIRSYKEKALPMLKGFTGAVERSNAGYTWDFDEKKLKGKIVGLVLGEEEFLNSTGKVRTRTYVAAVRSVDIIRDGKFEVPPLKKLDTTKTTTPTPAPFNDPFNNAANDDAPPFEADAPVAESMPDPFGDLNPFA